MNTDKNIFFILLPNSILFVCIVFILFVHTINNHDIAFERMVHWLILSVAGGFLCTFIRGRTNNLSSFVTHSFLYGFLFFGLVDLTANLPLLEDAKHKILIPSFFEYPFSVFSHWAMYSLLMFVVAVNILRAIKIDPIAFLSDEELFLYKLFK